MVRGRRRGRPAGNQNTDITTILANIQQRLEEQVAMMEQQTVIIHELQQGQNAQINQGNGGPGNKKPEGEDSEEEELETEVEQPRGVFRPEPLYKRFSSMKPPEFEGSTNPFDAE